MALSRVARAHRVARRARSWRASISASRPKRARGVLRVTRSSDFVRPSSAVVSSEAKNPVVCAPGPIVAMRAFATVDSERARESKARDELRKQQARVETVEKFSGLRIRNRVVASMVLEDKFADLRFARIPDLRHDFPGRWATAGVLVDKSVKQSSSGTSYSVWKLSDLTPNDNCVTVFLFGQAHLDHHREPEGTIWTVVDGKLREDAKSACPTVACDHESMITKIGTSPDFARCKGTRRDGGNCTMHVNKSASEFCAFHAASALKSLTTERMALGPGRAPKFVRNGRTVMGTKARAVDPTPRRRRRAITRRRVAMDGPSTAYTEEKRRDGDVADGQERARTRRAAMVGGVGSARAFPGMATDMRTGRAAGRALGAGVGRTGRRRRRRRRWRAQKAREEAAATRGRRIRAVRRIRCPLFDDARGQRAEQRFPAERAPVPLGSVVGVQRPREEDSPGGDGRRRIFRGGHGRDSKGADGGQDAPLARSQRVAETAPKSEGERSRGGGVAAANQGSSRSRAVGGEATRVGEPTRLRSRDGSRRRGALPGVLRGRLRGYRRGRDGWKIAEYETEAEASRRNA